MADTTSSASEDRPEGDGGELLASPADSEWGDEQVAEAVALFRQGNFAAAIDIATKFTSTEDEDVEDQLGDSDVPSPADTWRTALDDLATACEDAGDAERAEALYLRMLAWREGVEQFRAGHFGVAGQLFKQSPQYKTVEDATWHLPNLRPDSAHAISDVVGLLALGEEVAAKAAVAIWTLALRPNQRQKITESGGLELMAKAVAYHLENAELQAAGCGSLRMLCSGHKLAEENKAALVNRLGGVEALTKALQVHMADPQYPGRMTDPEVQREACGALRAIAYKNPVGARRILEHDGIMLCLRAIAECPDEAVGDAACKALSALHCAAQPTSAPQDGVAVDYQSRAVWEDNLRRQCENGLQFCDLELRRVADRHTLQAMLGAIYEFLNDPNARPSGISLLDPVIAWMMICPGHLKVQLPACGIINRLTMGHPSKEDAIQQVALSRGIGPVCQAIKDLHNNPDLVRHAISALRNISATSNSNKTLAVKNGAIPVIIGAMKREPQSADMQELGISILTSLCDTLGRAAICGRLGGFDTIVAAVKRHAGSGRIAELGCIILCMFCDDVQLRQQILRAGALAVAKNLAKTGKGEARRWGSELLRDLLEAQGGGGNP